jgi:large subunit ribosomal protein L4e
MFAPLKIWRKWHRKVNIKQKRHAVASALAASACAPLVLARGHRVMECPELPLVTNSLNVDSTAALLKAVNQLGAAEDLQRVRKSRKMRSGTGKYRYSRFTMRRGPLLIHGDDDSNVRRNARNLPGVDVCNVHRLNLLQLAPGGHLGRFCIFTNSAFAELDNVFGSYTQTGTEKSGYQLQRNHMDCADLARIINSDQVQAKLRDIRTSVRVHDKTKKNPLKNKNMMQKLNPNSNAARADGIAKAAERRTAAAALAKHKRSKAGRAEKALRTKRHNALNSGLEQSFVDAQKVIDDEVAQGKIGETSSEEEDDESDAE